MHDPMEMMDTEEDESWEEAGIESLAATLIGKNLIVEKGADDDGDTYLVVAIPDGASHRNIRIYEFEVDSIISVDFENIQFIDNYEAIVNVRTGEVEASLIGLSSIGSLSPRQLMRIPGAEITVAETRPSVDVDEYLTEGAAASQDWRIVLRGKKHEIELSPPSPLLTCLIAARRVSLKIRNSEIQSASAAKDALESLAESALFELDVRYNQALDLRRRRPVRLRLRQKKSEAAPSFPLNRYLPEPLALYRYGRSATGTPLLEFLAYYQVLEFFFPIFTREELIRRLRNSLRNPRFDLNDDASLAQIISLLQPQGRSLLSEREQLRATLRSCVTREFVEDFFHASDEAMKHFTEKPIVAGVNKISLNQQAQDLCDQVADRIYAIRCRVVHTKQESGETSVELLLPSSPEVQNLGPDIDLLRALAQQALIAGASSLNED